MWRIGGQATRRDRAGRAGCAGHVAGTARPALRQPRGRGCDRAADGCGARPLRAPASPPAGFRRRLTCRRPTAGASARAAHADCAASYLPSSRAARARRGVPTPRTLVSGRRRTASPPAASSRWGAGLLANAAWTVIAASAHNLLRWTSVLGLPGQTIRAARTLRRRLLALPGSASPRPPGASRFTSQPAGPGATPSPKRSPASARSPPPPDHRAHPTATCAPPATLPAAPARASPPPRRPPHSTTAATIAAPTPCSRARRRRSGQPTNTRLPVLIVAVAQRGVVRCG